VISQAAGSTTVRRGRWKLLLAPGRAPVLVDLENDAEEATDVSEQYPERVVQLQHALQAASQPPLARPVPRNKLGAHELETLRVLGYVE
jgi:hypothetical protein